MSLAHLIFQIGADSSELEKEARKARQTVTSLTDSMVTGMGQAGRASAQLDKVGMSAKQTAAAMRGVPAQITDIVVSLQGGQAPLTVLLQQGGQLKDMFGGIGAAANALIKTLVRLITIKSALAAVVVALGVAYYQGSKEADAYLKALVETGSAAGVTSGQLRQYAVDISKVSGTEGGAAATLVAMTRARAADGEMLKTAAAAAQNWSSATGDAVDKTAEKFAQLRKDPLQAALKLNEGMNFLTLGLYEQIKALEDQGRVTEAGEIAQKAYAEALNSRSAVIKSNLGYLEGAWNSLGGAARKAWDKMLNIGRSDTKEMVLEAKKAQLAARMANAPLLGNDAATERGNELLRSQIAALESEIGKERKAAQDQKAQADLVDATAAWDKRGEQFLSRQARMEEELARAKVEGAAAGKTQLEIETRLQQIREKYKDRAAGASAKAEQTAYDNLIASIRTKGQEIEQQLQQDQQLTESQKIRIKLDQELAQGKLKLSAAHQAQVRAEIADLERIEQKQKARQGKKLSDELLSEGSPYAADFLAQLNLLGTAYERGAISLERYTQAQEALIAKQPFAQQAAALQQARAEAEQYLAVMQKAQQRQVQAVGLGDRRRDYLSGLNQIEDNYAGRRYDLNQRMQQARDQHGGTLPDNIARSYAEQLALVEEFERKAKASYASTFEAITEAQGNWLNGANRAFANYADSAVDVAGQTANLFTRAFQGMEDALVSFVMTGKMDFKSLAESIIADLIRIQIRASMVQLLGGASGGGGLFGALMGGVSSYLGGSASAAASTVADVPAWMDGGATLSFGGGRERGGSVAAGTMYEVNEAGVPELLNIGQRQYLMMGQQSGSVVPLAGYSGGAVANAGGGQAAAPMQIDVQVINQGQPAQAEATVERQSDGSALVKVFLREVASDMAAGGVTARAVKQRFALQEA
ncbi:phage tail tape measure protein [Comamonas terrigena]|uniref:phage tail tape measure protein n=1 Tax=Comamonas terrigena TaxID=32013 RepID=UPI00244C79D1|nr:phage tail tape measure protein [Comamonas terrigena]MDH1700271.1 phage tail tape measure protein [Comamonas terrigena]